MLMRDLLPMLSAGFSVIPLKPRSKTPLLDWKEFQRRRASEQEVSEWLKKWPDMNVGVVTGEISNVTVLDLDGLRGLEWLQKQKDAVQSSLTTLSGSGGKHLWFKNDGSLRNSASKLADGVDIRGEGGYVAVPPSIHPNGCRYRWATTPRFSALSAVPTIILAGLQNVGTTPEVTKTVTFKPDNWIAESLEEMKNGHIHNTLISVLGKFRSHNFSIEDTEKLLRPYAFENGKPYSGLRAKIEEIWNRYEPTRNGGISTPTHSNYGKSSAILYLHTPTNPDSRKQYNDLQLSRGAVSEFTTGYQKFDTLTGGLRRGEVLTVAARTGVGKTNWLIPAIKYNCDKGKKVLLFSTEMSFDQIWSRYQAILSPHERFDEHQFFICDDFAPNLERIEEALKQCMPDMFLFDHINNIGDEHHALAEFMKGLKFLARKFNIPCIMTAQLNRGADWVENGERVQPRLSMIKGSGAIEEVSAQVLLLSETRVSLDGTEIQGVVDKNRHGDKGLVQFILKRNPYRVEEANA